MSQKKLVFVQILTTDCVRPFIFTEMLDSMYKDLVKTFKVGKICFEANTQNVMIGFGAHGFPLFLPCDPNSIIAIIPSREHPFRQQAYGDAGGFPTNEFKIHCANMKGVASEFTVSPEVKSTIKAATEKNQDTLCEFETQMKLPALINCSKLLVQAEQV